MYPFFAEKVIGLAITSSKKAVFRIRFILMRIQIRPKIEQIPIFVFLIFKVQNSQRGILLL